MKKILILTFLSFGFSGVALAASQGGLGTTSTGSVQINLTKADQVKISNLQDISFGTVVFSPNDQIIDVCIHSTTGSYDITASSQSGAGSEFKMANSSRNAFIKYDLEWIASSRGTSGRDLNHNQTSSEFGGADSRSPTCRGTTNSRLLVEVSERSFNEAPADAYGDVLTVIVSPR